MKHNNQSCRQQGHEQYKAQQVCTYRWCVMNRWCCPQCLSDEIHRHSMPNSNHIMNQEKLKNKIKQDIENLKIQLLDSKQGTEIKKLLSQLMKETFELEKLIIAFRQNLERQLNNSMFDYDNFALQLLMQKLEEQNFIQLNDEDINKLLTINYQSLEYNIQQQLQEPLDKIQQQSNILEQYVKQYQKNIKIIDFESRKYDIQKIHKVKDYTQYSSSLISNNEQYLVYNVRNLIYVYDLKMKKTKQVLQLKNRLRSFQFTNDSINLFIGDEKGFVYGYYVQIGYKTFYKQKIHEDIITQIKIQKQYLITASFDYSIIKTNFIKKTRIFILVGHTDKIISIDYDIYKDILISTSNDNSFKIWDCLNQSILIEYKVANSLFRDIQLINNKQDLLCHIDHQIYKFKVDQQNKKLVQTYSYIDQSKILGFQQVNNDQNLLLTCDKYCKILNKKGELIHITQHNFNLKFMLIRGYRQQLDNLNYIILQDNYSLHLLRVKNKK